MAQVATVDDLLDSLDYGKRTAEQDVLDALRDRYAVPPDADLRQALQHETPGRILATILDTLRPFAFMIQDVYGFLADAAVKTEGNLEVHVPLGEAGDLHLDLKRFRQYERNVVERLDTSALDPGLLPAEGQWRYFHDGYWPPRCFEQSRAGNRIDRCPHCPPETRAADFERLTRYFEELDQIAAKQLQLPFAERETPLEAMGWEDIRRRWQDCTTRVKGWGNECIMGHDWQRSFFETSLKEFEAAVRTYTIQDIRQFLALPYWKQRWQFYEVWFVMLALRSYGLANLELETEGQKWTLAVGGVMTEPIAVSRLRTGEAVEFYYQYEGIPPSPLFPETRDRPEMLVQMKEPSGGQSKRLVVAEVKARKSFSLQDMEGALFSLLKWDPVAVVGINYYEMGSSKGLNLLTIHETEIVAANCCTPRSETAVGLTEWLGAFWRRELGTFVTVVLIDTSSSMPEAALPGAVEHLRTLLTAAPTSELLVATFNDSTRFHSPDALDNGSISLVPRGGTALASAVSDCRAALQARFSDAGQLAVHVITDLEVHPSEVQELLQWVSATDTTLNIHTWPSSRVSSLTYSYPELGDCIEYLS